MHLGERLPPFSAISALRRWLCVLHSLCSLSSAVISVLSPQQPAPRSRAQFDFALPARPVSEYDGTLSRIALAFAAISLVAFVAGCSDDTSGKSDTELGLNAQQTAGRHLYQQTCAPCHDAHSVPG